MKIARCFSMECENVYHFIQLSMTNVIMYIPLHTTFSDWRYYEYHFIQLSMIGVIMYITSYIFEYSALLPISLNNFQWLYYYVYHTLMYSMDCCVTAHNVYKLTHNSLLHVINAYYIAIIFAVINTEHWLLFFYQ